MEKNTEIPKDENIDKDEIIIISEDKIIDSNSNDKKEFNSTEKIDLNIGSETLEILSENNDQDKMENLLITDKDKENNNTKEEGNFI